MIPRHDCISDRRTVSPASHRALSAFTAWLAARGHARSTIDAYFGAARHLLVWLRGRGRSVRSVTKDAIEEFATRHVPTCPCPPHGVKTVRAAVRRFHQITNAGVRRGRPVPRRTSAVDKEVQAYRAHLIGTCGLAESTCTYREAHVRKFLTQMEVRPLSGAVHLDVANVADYIGRQAASAGARGVYRMAGSLRSYVRWLSLRGLLEEEILLTVPGVRRPRLARMPRVLSASQLRKLLGSFDRRTSTGRRDFAMALCMAELGLRACEVAKLNIADIDWRQRTIRVLAAKSRRWRLLPLPHHVGAAVGGYLRKGRLPSAYPLLFVRHSVPRGTPLATEHVRGAMRRAYARAGFPTTWTGTHLLRHTAATLMHQRGATLKEVADVLGHLCIDTTMVYTKVNLPALRKVALPWPEVSP